MLFKGVSAVVDMFGMVEQVSITSTLLSSPLCGPGLAGGNTHDDLSAPPSIHSLESIQSVTEVD